MGLLKDLTNKKFGLLKVISRSENGADKKPFWLCKCACGNTKSIRGACLVNGDTQSCGCISKQNRKRFALQRTITHECSKTRIYSIWKNMRQRCFNKKCTHYKYYGGRGITMCPQWLTFENFLSDMGHPPSKDHTIERIDVHKGYNKENCKWILSKNQGLNKTNNRLITFKGETKILKEWEFITGIHCRTITSRIKAGWSVEDALTVKAYCNTYKSS